MRFFAVAIATTLLASNAYAGQVWLTMDQVRPYELKLPAGQIVVGNPGIADIQVQDKTRLLLFGKSPGLTNIFIFDDEGATIENLQIRVKSASNDMLTVHRGAARVTYNCTTRCEATATVGDDQTAFQEVASQSQAKFQQATASAGNN